VARGDRQLTTGQAIVASHVLRGMMRLRVMGLLGSASSTMRVAILVALSGTAFADDDTEPQDDALIESQPHHDAIIGPDGFVVGVDWHDRTGTYHFADRLVIESDSGKLVVEDKPESDSQVPLIEKVIDAGRGRWLVLGWSSYGEGMQTEHAWLVVDGKHGPRIADKLEWTSDRAHAGLALDAKRLRIGIPLPARSEQLHNGSDWKLVIGKRARWLSDVRRMRSAATHLADLPGRYTPPFNATPHEHGWSERFVWLEAAGDHFK
jgi:hypothetical protein